MTVRGLMTGGLIRVRRETSVQGARTSGWLAQWQEMRGDPEQKIARPRQLYLGPGRRGYVEIGKRHEPAPVRGWT